jgi:phosphoribosyl 1,2-cyclic phosphodiesterase
VAVNLTILGSGSAGNCAYLETDETRLLIDAGLSGRQIRGRLASIDRTPELLDGILITHEHNDHVQGLTTLCGKLRIPIFCNKDTKEAIEDQLNTRFDCRIFSTGATFEVGDVVVDTFSVPHDASDPVGFLVRTNAGNIGFLTDLGHATNLVIERVRTANVLLLETNHDLRLLQEDTKRPWSIKQRILSRHGHLSNDDAAGVVEQIVSSELRHLFLGHLSRDCNQPERAIGAVSERLQKMGAHHVRIEAASQDLPCSTLSL